MSSGDEDDHFNDGGFPGGLDDSRLKKRKVQRACDICRRKKIKCDGGQMPGNKCSNCIAYSFDCTYVEAAKKRGPPKGYVESLENRLEKMEKLLQRLCPDADFTQELGGAIDRESWYNERSGGESKAHSSSKKRSPTLSHPPGLPGIAQALTGDEELIPSEDERNEKLDARLKSLSLHTIDKRFHGKSSGYMLIQAAVTFKREYSGVDDKEQHVGGPHRRPEFWSPCPWEFRDAQVSLPEDFTLPPADLIDSLIDIFFMRINPFHPLLHRPLFEKQYREGLHETDSHFTAVLLLLCACSSRYSEDPRVFLDSAQPHSAGWKYFEQVQPFRRFQISAPRLFDLQVYVLSTIFLAGSSAPHAAWTMVGIGIRMAQDVGAHRHKVYNSPRTLQDELYKRAFWILVGLDRSTSASFGRPCALQDEDFDVDLPVEIDDEYWELCEPGSGTPLSQPEGRPPVLAFMICYMKLTQILAFALRTIYSINKSKVLMGFIGPQWEQHIVAELDSALNKWIDSVPDHLRWDPNRDNQLWFEQSALLYATYYHLQILIHRPFIPSPKKPSPLSFPSLAICTNAARSCSHVVDAYRRRAHSVMPWIAVPAFTSGIVLLLNIWGVKKSATSPDAASQMEDVYKCMYTLKIAESRWHAAGRLWDILCELASFRDFPLPGGSPPESWGKRERDSDSPTMSGSGSPFHPSPVQSQGPPIPRPVAKGKSLLASRGEQSNQKQMRAAPSINFTNGLPFSTQELSQMPIHPAYNQYYGHSGLNADAGWMAPDSLTASQPSMHEFGLGQFSLYDTPVATAPVPTVPTHNVYQPATYPVTYPEAQQAFKAGAVQPRPPDLQTDAMGMWSNPSTSFEWDDWGTYVQPQNPLQHPSG